MTRRIATRFMLWGLALSLANSHFLAPGENSSRAQKITTTVVELPDEITILPRQETAHRPQQQLAAEQRRSRMKDAIPSGRAAAMLVDDLPGLDRRLAVRLAERIEAQGVKVESLNADEVSNPLILTVGRFHTLVLANSQVYPVEGMKTLERFLAQGGDLIALATPAFLNPVLKVNGKWVSKSDWRRSLAAQKPRILFDFETDKLEGWGDAAIREVAEGGANGTRQGLRCVVADFETWNTLRAPYVQQPFGEGESVTCLWAKGGARTTRLALEWIEQDGSRWIATIPLTTGWQYHVLTPDQFHYWHDNPSKGRGASGDHFRPENALAFSVGISMSHTPMGGGRHEFWVDEIGVANDPSGVASSSWALEIVPIETITPTYKFHAVTAAVTLKVSDKQCLLGPAQVRVPAGLMSVQPRPQGTGYNKERKWRWIPLMEAFNAEGEVCGTPACLLINRVGNFKDSIVASFCLPISAYQDTKVLDMVAVIAKRMRDGFFLFEGGAEYYAYFQGEEVTLGACTLNTSALPDPKCSVMFIVTSSGGKEFEKTAPVRSGRAECKWTPGNFDSNTYQVTCALLDTNGNTVDMLTHPVVVCEPSKRPDYMQIKDGDFFLRGKKWYAHGVNYMPSSGIGTEDGEYFEFWMDKQPYDPVVIERDLRRIKAVGMNMVSIYCHYRSLNSRNLLDILERCRRRGLMVNLSLRPGSPFDFRWEEMKALIETHRLARNDGIFAYDLAWEPVFGPYEDRKRWDGHWEKWIIERYGSIENAEQDWGAAVPRVDGKVTGPSDQQVTEDGGHRVMVCAYRRFLDDLLAKAHAVANGRIKSIDSNHFTSFRMAGAGDPTSSPAHIMFDFRGLARSTDIMEPEGYGRIGEWERVRPGRFTADYSRCMAPGRPVMWAEFGCSSWNTDTMDRDVARENWVGDFYRRFYRMAYESDANGTVCWFYPGGYRYNERSDFGIINPDGTWRPATHAIREWAKNMTTPRQRRPVVEYITIDRDATVRGVLGVYEAVKEGYWLLIEQGKNPGLRTDGHGLDSATAPRIAVGNTPYKPSRNPHKYLNAEFDKLEVKNLHGEWQAVADGSVVKVRRGNPVAIRATVGNIGDAKWLAGGGSGQVGLAGGRAFIPIPHDVPFMETVRVEGVVLEKIDAAINLTIEMLARPDVVFGEKRTLRVEPE